MDIRIKAMDYSYFNYIQIKTMKSDVIQVNMYQKENTFYNIITMEKFTGKNLFYLVK